MKKILLLFVLLFLLTSVFQREFFESQGRTLAGISAPHPNSFTWTSWMDKTFQDSQQEFLDFHAGFRNSLVRLHNQIDFSLFI